MDKVISTLLTVIIAVGASAALWVGANLLFNQVTRRWHLFTAIAYAIVGFFVGVLLHGNQLTRGSGDGFLAWVWFPLLAALVFAGLGSLLEQTSHPQRRQVIGVASGVGVGVAVALMVLPEERPGLDWLALIVWTAGVAVVGAALSAARKRSIENGALIGGGLGSLVGGWGAAELGSGSIGEALLASVVPAALVGFRLGMTKRLDLQERGRLSGRSRAVIFLLPALLFILIALIIPAVRTLYLSFYKYDVNSNDGGIDPPRFAWFRNYAASFSDRNSWNTENWTNIFTSRLFFVGAALLIIAVVTGLIAKKRTGKAVEMGNPTMAPLIFGALLLSFAVFTSLRGTIVNNLWWIVVVVSFSTTIGLAIAVLADNARNEKLAKSLIFMPLAISLVGASIIWRLVYRPRDVSTEQTGLLNGLWVGLGRLSSGSGLPTFIVGVVVAAALIALLIVLVRALVRREYGRAAFPGVVVLLLGWFFLRYIGSGVGGVRTNEAGQAVLEKIDFVQEGPFNNLFLMIILVWIQTGFAMVILSAAIKAVPGELIEAARVDGATPSQVFWRVTLPQISTTIGVVVTTLIVLVMKVFDIVKVVTNGTLDTQVLANDMYNQAFQFGDTGRGAALAMIILISVLPVMFFNIRRMQREA